MSKRLEILADQVIECLGDRVERIENRTGEVTIETTPEQLLEVATLLRDAEPLAFDTLIDLCGMDYSEYERDEWKTRGATSTGFSRGVDRAANGHDGADGRRFAVVCHLLSVERNHRLRLRVFAAGTEPPIVPSLVDIWPAANWYEREAFDLFGILFDGHPDLRRLLTDYGFVGHPFRKDFPLSGNVEVRYDPEQARVIYEPVSIEPRTLVPRVIRDDHRYEAALKDAEADG
jgi:NADH-quinone oxidoreductase subunit C